MERIEGNNGIDRREYWKEYKGIKERIEGNNGKDRK